MILSLVLKLIHFKSEVLKKKEIEIKQRKLHKAVNEKIEILKEKIFLFKTVSLFNRDIKNLSA